MPPFWKRNESLEPFRQKPYKKYRIEPYTIFVVLLAVLALLVGTWLGSKAAQIAQEGPPPVVTQVQSRVVTQVVRGKPKTVTVVKPSAGTTVVTTFAPTETHLATTVKTVTTTKVMTLPASTVTETETVTTTAP